MIERGYLYIAIGKKYVREAQLSARSLKQHDSNAHTTLITDQCLEILEFDVIEIVPNDFGENIDYKSGILYKVNGLLHSPYQKTFFADTDTYFLDSCTELFDLLEYYDLLIAPDASDRSRIMVNNSLVEGYIPYNTGIMVFKNSKSITNLFSRWLALYHDKINIYQQDQPAFIEALLSNPVYLYALHSIYNFRLPCHVAVPNGFVKILHGRSNAFELLNLEINRTERNRAWDPIRNKIIMKKNIYEKLYDIIPRSLRMWLKEKLL